MPSYWRNVDRVIRGSVITLPTGDRGIITDILLTSTTAQLTVQCGTRQIQKNFPRSQRIKEHLP